MQDNGDQVITLQQVQALLSEQKSEAIVIRTIPNDEEKKNRQYSFTNPPYVENSVMPFLIQQGIKHFLIDLPSVDKEQDDGKLLAHKAFWEYPEQNDKGRTITEFIFVPNEVTDGWYFMNLQVANFVNDAGPSRPVLYPIIL